MLLDGFWGGHGKEKGSEVASGADTPASLGLWYSQALDLGTSALSLCNWQQPPTPAALSSQQQPFFPKISPQKSSHSSGCPNSICRALPEGLSTELYITLGFGLMVWWFLSWKEICCQAV